MAALLKAKKMEDLYGRTFGRGVRILGISSSIKNDGASFVAHSLAAHSAASGKPTLLVTNNADQPTETQKVLQQKSFSDIGSQWADTGHKSLKTELNEALQSYRQVVVDLGHTSKTMPHHENILRACEAVFLVCRPSNVCRTTILSAIDDLNSKNVRLAGLVTNDEAPPTMSEQILREFSEMSWMFPKSIQDFIAKKAEQLR